MRDLSERHRIAAAVVALGDALWVRIAAQAYNEMADYERLAARFAPRAHEARAAEHRLGFVLGVAADLGACSRRSSPIAGSASMCGRRWCSRSC